MRRSTMVLLAGLTAALGLLLVQGCASQPPKAKAASKTEATQGEGGELTQQMAEHARQMQEAMAVTASANEVPQIVWINPEKRNFRLTRSAIAVPTTS